MNDARLAEIEARAAAATPGPWRASTGRTHDPSTGRVTSVEHWISRGDDDMGITGDVCDSHTGEPSIANATFIAHARTDVPDLIAEVRRLRAENATLRALADGSASLVRQREIKEREACVRIAERARRAQDRLRALTPSSAEIHAHGASVAEAIRDEIRARGGE